MTTLLIRIAKLFLYLFRSVLKRRHLKACQGEDKVGPAQACDFGCLFLGYHSHFIPLDGCGQRISAANSDGLLRIAENAVSGMSISKTTDMFSS
jgi:hypothetical protein